MPSAAALTRPAADGPQGRISSTPTPGITTTNPTGRGIVAVLEHNGVAVYVHPDQRASGMAMISVGAAEAAETLARGNGGTLQPEAVRQGYHIVASEPSAALCLTHGIPICSATTIRGRGEFPARSLHVPLEVAPIGPIATRSAAREFHAWLSSPVPSPGVGGVGSPGENLLQLIPALKVSRLLCLASPIFGPSSSSGGSRYIAVRRR